MLSARYLGKPGGLVGATGTGRGVLGPSALPTSTWSHLAFTSDGTTLTLYIDGQVVATSSAIAAAATGANLTIGHNTLLGGYFDGLIDEVRLYGQALSQGEVQTDQATPVMPVAPSSLPTNITSDVKLTAANSPYTGTSVTVASYKSLLK